MNKTYFILLLTIVIASKLRAHNNKELAHPFNDGFETAVATLLVHDKVTNDTTPTLTGTGGANAILTVNVDTNADGTAEVTYTTTADANGDWSVDPDNAKPDSGTFTALSDNDVISVLVTTTGNGATGTVRIDTSKPDALNSASNDPNTPTITGTAEPNEELIVDIDFEAVSFISDITYTVTADAKGDWSINLGTTTPTSGGPFVPLSDDSRNIIVVKDMAGNQDEATLLIDLLTPTVNTNPSPKTRPVLRGTAEPGERLTVSVDYDNDGMLDVIIDLTADTNGNWRVDTATDTPSGGAFKTLSDNDIITISVTDRVGNRASGTVSIDTTPPTVGGVYGAVTRDTLPTIRGRREGIDDLLTVELDVNGNGKVVTYAITKDHRADGPTYWEISTATDTPTSGGPFTALRDDDVVFVTATDAAGNTATGTVRIDTIRPTISTKTVSDPTPILKGRGEAYEQLIMLMEYSNRGSSQIKYRLTVDANGDWSLDTATAKPFSGGLFLPFNHNERLRIDIDDGSFGVNEYYIKTDLLPPTVDTKTTNDITPTLTGKAEANEVLTVDVDTDNNGTTDLSYTITVANDAWSIDTGAVAPNNGVLFPTLRDKDIIGVTVTDAASNSGSGTVRIDTSALSVEDLEQKNRVYVYPNPVSETLNFSFGSKIPYHATVYDLSGKKRLSAELPQLSLDVSSLDKGVYFVVVEHTSGEKQTLKFIKENKP